MTPTRFRECLKLLRWSPSAVAKDLGWSARTGGMWASGGMEIPDDVAKWLEVRAKHAERFPPPVKEKRS